MPSVLSRQERASLESLTPACSLVYRVLIHAERPLSTREIARRTPPVAPRTARRSLGTLSDMGLVREAGVRDPGCPQYVAVRCGCDE